MRFPRLGALFCSLLLVAFSGCASGPKFGGITVNALTLQLSSAAGEVRAPLTLRFANENVVPLAYSGSLHKVYINGTYVGKAQNQEPIGLPPINEATREVYLQFDKPEVARLLAAGGNQTANYRMETTLFQTAGDDKLKITTLSEGTIEIKVGGN